MKVILKYFILLCLIIIPSVDFSASVSESESAKIFSSGGIQILDLYELNGMLSGTGYPEINPEFISAGTLYQYLSGRWLVEFDFNWLLKQQNELNQYTTALTGFSALFNLGIRLINSDNVHLYPYAGAGYSKLNLVITESGSPSFTEMISSPPVNLSLEKKGFCLNAGLGLDFVIKMSQDINSPALIVGIRGGYMYQPGGNWKANSVELLNEPGSSFTGYYVRLMFGFGEMTIE